ncbi:MAG TPA: acetylxylan esterase [Gemmataceae bacterium]|jgi:dienelactone hydrolase|nr:acetylxylan esterase [Gemmataceae bacterium]
MYRPLALLLFLLPIAVRADESVKTLTPEQTRKAFLQMLDRPRVEPDVKDGPGLASGAIATHSFTFASEKKRDGAIERVPVLLVRPAKEGRYPVMIALHGTGGKKEDMKSWLNDLAQKGIIGVAIDARYHGDRSGGAKGSAAYVAAITNAWKAPNEEMEHPFYYDTVWDLWRLIDVLEKRSDVDPKRIGMMGISMGGIQTWLAASVDERVAVAMPLIGVQSFRWSLDHDKWQGRANTIKGAHEAAAKDLGEPMVNGKVCKQLWNKVIPGILDEFDCPNMLKLMAGRPLYIANGTEDGNCPIEGARIAIRAAEAAYDKAGAQDKLKVSIANGVGHKVTDEQKAEALAFCEKWLKP